MAENILLYFSDTGRGHRSATEAIESALQLVAEKEFSGLELNLIAEPVAEQSHPINRAFVELYNYLLRKHQNLMKYYYSLLHVLKPNERESAYRLSREYLMQSLIKHSPSVVVSMHPMTNHFIKKAMGEVGIGDKVKMVIIVTDPNKNLWRGWACPDADLIIAPNNLVKEKLMEWGVDESRIKILGMPVNPEFLNQPRVGRDEFLSHLGLSPSLPTLCINAGWAGGGNMLAAYRSLSSIQNAGFQILFLCGHNQELYEQAKEEAANSNIPTAVLPFHDCMPDLMAAVDTMVTKAGGLTTFECIARRLPMIVDVITPPMPQEAGTVDILVETGLARKLERPEQLAQLVHDLKRDPQRLTRPLPEAYSLDQTHAVFDIARTIVQNTNFTEVKQPRGVSFESGKSKN
jgi:UDP-N-acetylglucosamine:LPS N-acetylglucosamine transferase